jgi:hypothetical protein
VKPSHGEPPGISAQDDERRALVEQREALLQILELGQKDFHAGDFRDLDEFLEELDSDSADVSMIVSFSAETFLESGEIRRAVCRRAHTTHRAFRFVLAGTPVGRRPREGLKASCVANCAAYQV